MILPTKQIPPSHSLIGIGSLLLSRLRRATTVSALWHSVNKEESIGSFERFLLTLSMLYTMELIDLQDGLIIRKKATNAEKN
jgi:hypothetical protein